MSSINKYQEAIEVLLQNEIWLKQNGLVDFEDEPFRNKINLALNYYFLGEYKESLDCLEKAFAIKHEFIHLSPLNYELIGYETAYKASIELGLQDRAFDYSTMYIEASKYNEEYFIKHESVLREIYKTYEQADMQNILMEAERDKNKFKKRWLWLFPLFVLACVGLVLYWLRNKQIKRRYESIIQEFTNKNEKQKHELRSKQSEANAILSDKQNEVLLKLTKFEQGDLFLRNDMNLALLASKLKIHPRTLSKVVNQVKQINFNDYINTLRINYLIQKLKEEEEYRKYTISVWAEDIGFADHASFTKTFKKLKGLTPSQFIKLMKENKSALVL